MISTHLTYSMATVIKIILYLTIVTYSYHQISIKKSLRHVPFNSSFCGSSTQILLKISLKLLRLIKKYTDKLNLFVIPDKIVMIIAIEFA